MELNIFYDKKVYMQIRFLNIQKLFFVHLLLLQHYHLYRTNFIKDFYFKVILIYELYPIFITILFFFFVINLVITHQFQIFQNFIIIILLILLLYSNLILAECHARNKDSDLHVLNLYELLYHRVHINNLNLYFNLLNDRIYIKDQINNNR